MKFKAIDTPVGIVAGRNAIYLDSIDYNYDARTVSFSGQFDAGLCRGYKGDKAWIDYTISYRSVIYFRQVELDHYSPDTLNEITSSIDENTGSELLAALKEIEKGNKISPDHKHYLLATYDDIFDVVARDIKIELKMD